MDKDHKKILVILCIYGILFIGFFALKNTKYDLSSQISNSNLSNADHSLDQDQEEDEFSQQEIYVHIGGEVNYPGLIVLENGSRLYEAIDKAGGTTEEADIDQVNLAQVLSDQDKIIIPQKGQNLAVDDLSQGQEELININTASKEELMKLNGVGEKTAESIIEYRQDNSFEKIEDIMDVPGIGEGKFKQMEKQITK